MSLNRTICERYCRSDEAVKRLLDKGKYCLFTGGAWRLYAIKESEPSKACPYLLEHQISKPTLRERLWIMVVGWRIW